MSEPSPTTPTRRRRPGRRTAARRRRRRVLLWVLAVGLVVAVAGVLTAAGPGLLERVRELAGGDDEGADPGAGPEVEAPAAALVVTRTGDGQGLNGVTALVHDDASDEGTVVLVPTATVVDVPGHGAFSLAEAHRLGGTPLLAVSLANLLDVAFDATVEVQPDGWGELATAFEGLQVEVPERLAVVDPRLEAGSVRLGGARLAAYLTARADGETELEALPRMREVIVGLLDEVVEEPARAEELAAAFVVDAPGLAALFEALASARGAERLTALTLPVEALGSGREDSYRIDEQRAERLLGDRLEAARPSGGPGEGRRVQILNGNGLPGVGQQVAELLRDGGYRVVLTGNADRFTHEETRILVHDDGLDAAEDVADRLGVGSIERSGTPQSVVDLTVVVGGDFPP